ncbi:MAG: helix-turn-helix domain-containing protein [Burkholderiales bacterium]|nr:helix-turn-helix domain-containing protein [Burkholderiales bacterium]
MSGKSPTRAVTVVDFTDPTAAGTGLELLAQDAVQLQTRAFHARRVTVDLDSAKVFFHATNHRVRTRTAAHQGLLAYVVFGPQTLGSVNGVPVRADLMLAVPPHTETGFVADAGWQSVAVLVAPAVLEAHLAARQRLDELRLPRRVEPMRAEVPLVRQLFDLGLRVVETAVQDPARFDDSAEERSSAQVELIEALLAALRSSSDTPLARSDLTRQMQSSIVKAAEDYAMARIGQRIYVSDLCQATATSERALEYAFKTVVGLSPVQFLARLRLHRAREALLLAPAGGAVTVSTIALDWGFWHFGEFARAYKELFDELPSDTLRRRGAATA